MRTVCMQHMAGIRHWQLDVSCSNCGWARWGQQHVRLQVCSREGRLHYGLLLCWTPAGSFAVCFGPRLSGPGVGSRAYRLMMPWLSGHLSGMGFRCHTTKAQLACTRISKATRVERGNRVPYHEPATKRHLNSDRCS